MPGCIGSLNDYVDNLSSTYFTKSELKAVFEGFHHSVRPPEEISVNADLSNPSILIWSIDPSIPYTSIDSNLRNATTIQK